MYFRLRCAAFVLGVIGLPASVMNAADEPCSGRYFMARPLGNVLDLNLTAQELKLLNGREDPKLKRHLEWRLVSAAADARRDVDSGSIWEKSSPSAWASGRSSGHRGAALPPLGFRDAKGR
jgi:hypothetical protein